MSRTLIWIQLILRKDRCGIDFMGSPLTIGMSVFNMYLVLRSALQFHKLSLRGLEMFTAYYFHSIAPASQKVDVSHGRWTNRWIMLDPAG